MPKRQIAGASVKAPSLGSPGYRPVTPAETVSVSKADVRAKNIADALGLINTSIAGYTKIQEDLEQSNARKAVADFYRGEKDKPNNLLNIGVGYNQAWDMQDGYSAAVKASAELTNELTANSFYVNDLDNMKPDDLVPEVNRRLQERIGALKDSLFSGKSDSFLIGAHQVLEETQNRLSAKATEAVQGKIKENAIGRALSSFNNHLALMSTEDSWPPNMKQFLDQIWKGADGELVRQAGGTFTEFTTAFVSSALAQFDTLANNDDAASLKQAEGLWHALAAPSADGHSLMTITDERGVPRYASAITQGFHSATARIEGGIQKEERLAGEASDLKVGALLAQASQLYAAGDVPAAMDVLNTGLNSKDILADKKVALGSLLMRFADYKGAEVKRVPGTYSPEYETFLKYAADHADMPYNMLRNNLAAMGANAAEVNSVLMTQGIFEKQDPRQVVDSGHVQQIKYKLMYSADPEVREFFVGAFTPVQKDSIVTDEQRYGNALMYRLTLDSELNNAISSGDQSVIQKVVDREIQALKSRKASERESVKAAEAATQKLGQYNIDLKFNEIDDAQRSLDAMQLDIRSNPAIDDTTKVKLEDAIQKRKALYKELSDTISNRTRQDIPDRRVDNPLP